MTRQPLARAVAAFTAAALFVSIVPASAALARSSARVPAAASAGLAAERNAQERKTARTVIVSTNPGTDVRSTLASNGPVPALSVRPLGNSTFAVELAPEADVASATALLDRSPQVTGVCRDVQVRLATSADPNDPVWTFGDSTLLPFGQRTGLGARAQGFTYSVDAASAWARALGAGADRLPPGRPGIKIGVIDTGYAFTAPTFDSTSAIVPGWNYADGNADLTDHVGHGTEVTNVIRAQADNASQVAGSMGALPGTVVVYKIFPGASDAGSLDAMIAAINGAANAGCKVINISSGISPYDPSVTSDLKAQITKSVDYATSKGALVVCAAGNWGDWPSYRVWWPAASPNALAVSSVNTEITSTASPRSSFSCFGPEVDVCAPGGETDPIPAGIATVDMTGQTIFVAGTSFAAPIVAAVAASLRGFMPAASVSTIRDVLERHSATHLGTGADGTRNDFYGYGLASADAAWANLTTRYSAQTQPATLTASQQAGTRLVHLSWPAVAGTGTVYRYGLLNGETRTTTALSADVVFPEDGPETVRVEAVSDDHLAGTAATGRLVNVLTGTAPLPVTRAEGADRYGTSVQVSRSSFPTSAPAIVIASGENWPDALSAGPLARKLGGPLLLTRSASLPYQTRDEIRRLVTDGPSSITVKIVGGTGSVSDTVRNQVSWAIAAAGHTPVIDRVAGATRYETAVEVANRLGSAETTCVITSAAKWPDALAAGPLAAAASWPILLVPATGAPPASTGNAIKAHGIRTALVAGGSGTVATATADALPLSAPKGKRWIRVAGVDRTDTSRRIADWAADNGILTGGALGLATGTNFPDGLSAGPAQALRSSPIVLAIDSPALVSPLVTWARTSTSSVGSLEVYGGTGALPLALQQQVEVALRPAP